MLPFVPTEARTILDVGCHFGGFGAALRRADPSRVLWAVEADADAATSARASYDRVIEGSYPDALAGIPTRFDCIIFNDVLEHMADPWRALRAAGEHLSTEGSVVASIPNVRHIKVVANLVLRGDWSYTDMGILDRTHLRFFTARTIRSLFSECGFVIERMEGINALGHVRFRYWKIFPLLLGELAYTEFAVIARPSRFRPMEDV